MNMTQNNWTFIIAAYGAAWIAIGGYWLRVHSVLRRARERYEESVPAAARAAGSP